MLVSNWADRNARKTPHKKVNINQVKAVFSPILQQVTITIRNTEDNTELLMVMSTTEAKYFVYEIASITEVDCLFS